jgi:hypothetical protein
MFRGFHGTLDSGRERLDEFFFSNIREEHGVLLQVSGIVSVSLLKEHAERHYSSIIFQILALAHTCKTVWAGVFSSV